MWRFGELMLDGEAYDYSAKVYDLGSIYGIDGGRISKLDITHRRTGTRMVHYEREWVIPRPGNWTHAGKLLKMVLDMYKEEA